MEAKSLSFIDSAVESVCGFSSRPDWDAISAIATVAAVAVALFISGRDHRVRRREQRNADAKSAKIVAAALSSSMVVMPNVIALVRESRGAIAESSGMSVIYGIDACNEILSVEPYIHGLPLQLLSQGLLVLFLAKTWIRDIEARRQDQRALDNPNSESEWDPYVICSNGDELVKAGLALKESCNRVSV